MDFGAVIEVAIGMIFMWITLSLATIQIQEWIITGLDKRAKDMEASLHEMLANPNLKSQFYDHPVIRGLTARKRKRPSAVPAWFYKYPIVRGFTKEKRKLPSYIPSQEFALALFDITMTAGTESSLIQQGILKIRDDFEKASNRPRDKAVIDALNILSDLARSAAAGEAKTAITNYTKGVLIARVRALAERYKQSGDKELELVGQALERALREAKLLAEREIAKVQNAILEEENARQESLKKEKNPLIREIDPVLKQLRRGVGALSVVSPELNQTLSTLLLNVEEYTGEKERQIARARQNVENWFNSSMDRVSGVFKRFTQAMALILGIVLSLLLNVDSIALAQYLWREPTVRQVLAAQAATYTPPEGQPDANPLETVQQVTQQFTVLNLPMGWDLTNNDGPAVYDSSCQLFPRGTSQSFGIPVFWSNFCIAPSQTAVSTNIGLKLLGILFTAGATAQGAPFWFDLLKKVVNLRNTGPNPIEKGAK